MKVLQINSVCGVKSTGRICTDLAQVLEKNGHQCRIAYGRDQVPQAFLKYAIPVGNGTGVRLDAIKTRIFDNAGFNSVRATKKLIGQIKDYAPDIIHLHNLHGYYINIEVLFDFLKAYNKPVVWTLHDCWAFTGHCAHFAFAGCDRWLTGCHSCPQKGEYPKSAVLDRSEKNYSQKKKLFTALDNLTVVTPSEWLKDLAEQSFLGKYPVITINNGIDLGVFKPTESDFKAQHGIENKKIVLGVATVWDERKGLEDFIALSRILDESYKIILVGLTPQQISQLPVGIIGIGRTDSVKQLAQIYTAADVFVNPSRQETMGMTTVEAMACGTPVIASNYTAVSEVVSTQGGIVLDKVDAQTIKEGIDYVLNSQYANTRSNAEKYEKNAQYEKYIELYKGLIK